MFSHHSCSCHYPPAYNKEVFLWQQMQHNTVLAQILAYLKLYELPQGGSITLAMVPIFFFAVRWGWKKGLGCAFVFGLLQLLLDGGFAIGWQSMLGDYLIAFGVLGLAGIFTGKPYSIFAGTVVGSVARFLVHWVVGATIWAEYMPDEFFGMTMTSPWFYSALYNGSYMLPDMIVSLVVFAVLYVPLKKYLLGEDLKQA